MLVFIYIYIYIYSTNIPPIMIINRIYEIQNLLSLVSFLVGLRTYQHPCIRLSINARFKICTIWIDPDMRLRGLDPARDMNRMINCILY